MNRENLIAALLKLPADKMILCQIVAQNGGAWGMHFDFEDAPETSFIQLRVWHPQLLTMPIFQSDSDSVPLPQNADQAAGMLLVSTAWLKQNAPERIKTPNV